MKVLVEKMATPAVTGVWDWMKRRLGPGSAPVAEITAKLNDTPGHPVVTGISQLGTGKRVLFYGHYDVQPVDPVNLWESPPFEPVLKPAGAEGHFVACHLRG